MIEETLRRLNGQERKLLTSELSRLDRARTRGAVRVVLFVFALWVSGGVAILRDNRGVLTLLALWAAILATIAGWVLWDSRRKSLARRRRFQDALDRNQARVVRIRSAATVEFEETEDEGACYAFQISGDSIVFVCGQEFYASANFPNSDFSLVTILDSRGGVVESAIAKHGRRIHPSRTIAAAVWTNLRMPEHLEIVRGRLEDLEGLLILHPEGDARIG
jgi:hypothetical protein